VAIQQRGVNSDHHSIWPDAIRTLLINMIMTVEELFVFIGEVSTGSHFPPTLAIILFLQPYLHAMPCVILDQTVSSGPGVPFSLCRHGCLDHQSLDKTVFPGPSFI
jgi:hypothetical protein